MGYYQFKIVNLVIHEINFYSNIVFYLLIKFSALIVSYNKKIIILSLALKIFSNVKMNKAN